MKRNFKRTLALLLSVLMVVAAVPFVGVAAECEHEYTYNYYKNEQHIKECSKCGDAQFVKCYGGTATCKEKAKCKDCGAEYGELSTVHGETTLIVEDAYLDSPATCQSAAFYYKVCTVCMQKTQETVKIGLVDPDAHVYGEATPNTDELEGTHSAVCSLCNENVKSAECYDEEPNVIAPTCTTPGKTENKCDACGYEWTSDEKAATGHDFSKPVQDDAHLKSAATCTAKATYWYGCADCDVIASQELGADKYYEFGDMLAHDFTAEKAEERYIVSAANCLQKAVYYKSCAACGLSSEGTENEATFEGATGTHTWTTYTSNNDAKCGVDGTETSICDICEEATDTRTDEGSALDHVYTEKLKDEAHLKSEATCTAQATYYYDCAREGCNANAKDLGDDITEDHIYADGELAAHEYTRETEEVKTPATCTTPADYWYGCANCDALAKDDADAQDKFFADPEGILKAHKYTQKKKEDKYIATRATCTTDAIYWLACEACLTSAGEAADFDEVAAAAYYIDEGSAPGHAPEVHIKAKEPTCLEKGCTEGRKCSREGCGAILKESTEIDALGHSDYISIPAKEATCVRTGNTEEKRCARCEMLTSLPSVTIAAKGHLDEDDDGICDRDGCMTLMPEDACGCICHSTGLMRIIYVLVRLIWKLTGSSPYCDCGVQHY